MRDVTLNQKEQARIQVLNSVLEYQLPIAEAAEVMGVSQRHAKRLLAAYRKDGGTALAHGNRGRRPHNAVPAAAAAAVVKLASNHYAGANHSHLTELLREREGIDLSRPTVRHILVKAGLGSPQPPLPTAPLPAKAYAPRRHAGADRRQPTPVATWCSWKGLVRQWGIPLALYSDRHAAFKYNARRVPVLAESTQFARVIRELGINQIFALSPQAKGRVERMMETFQDRLVTELRLAGASTIGEADEALQEFLPRFNAQFAVAAEHSETAYRPVPDELSLTETICLNETRKVGRDNTVKYHWRVLQLLPGTDRPSYAGLRVNVLERTDGELLIRYDAEAVDFQEAPQPSSALWRAGGTSFPGPELQRVTNGVANSHLNEAQRNLLVALESANEEGTEGEGVDAKGRGGKGKPLRHSLHRTPRPAQQARWEAVQQAKRQGLSLRSIARKLGMSRVAVRKYASAESPPTKMLSVKERAKVETLAQSLVAAD